MRGCGLALAIAVAVGLVRYHHLDDRLGYLVAEHFTSDAERKASIWLPGYRAVIQAKPLRGLDGDEPSDLAYNPRTGTLFTVTGRDPQLVELTRYGKVLRSIPLIGFANPEGVAVLEDGQMAIVDERRRSLSFFTLDPHTERLSVFDTVEHDLGFPEAGNKGFEGIAWDQRSGRLLLGKERNPRGLFSWVPGTDGDSVLPLQGPGLEMRNLSALSIDGRTGHRLVLSAQSNLLLELDERGEPVSFISLLRGFNGLEASIPRAEGVAIDEQGTLYIVSEPNLFYVFMREDAADEP
ncbi:SdiA-regulated domain-containing protein [Stutzerimonas urumqiensis]|uniref:SdiA-regulated domain-containing protein n=1 Tax=Stutzerimonas urumqiensis TaxID=638269 RepID=UPI003BAC793E